MILYTAMPLELVLEDNECERKFQQVEIDSVKLLVEATGREEGRIVQIISTNPDDFLNPDIQPGRTVKFFPSGRVIN